MAELPAGASTRTGTGSSCGAKQVYFVANEQLNGPFVAVKGWFVV